MKGEICKFTIIFRDFKLPFSEIVRATRLKISKDMGNLNKMTDPLDLIYIYKMLHPKTEGHKIFKYTWNIYYDSQSLAYETSLNEFKRIQSIQRPQ